MVNEINDKLKYEQKNSIIKYPMLRYNKKIKTKSFGKTFTKIWLDIKREVFSPQDITKTINFT